MEIPPGFRFCPKDGEIVVHYLRRKIENQPLPCQIINNEVDLYRYDDPLELIANNEATVDQKEWYFFTRRTKVSKLHEGGSNIDRTTRKGFWKATGSKPVKYEGVEVGSRMNLVFFYGTPSKKEKTNWLMNEFMLGTNKRSDDWVLCKVYNHKDCINTINAQPETVVPHSGSELPQSTPNELHVPPETLHTHSGSELTQSTPNELHVPLDATTWRPEDRVSYTIEELENPNLSVSWPELFANFDNGLRNSQQSLFGEEQSREMSNNNGVIQNQFDQPMIYDNEFSVDDIDFTTDFGIMGP